MDFKTTYQRLPFGNEVTVQVSCASAHSITRVTTTYDAAPIGDDTLAGHTTQYDRTFSGLAARAGAQHTLVITALDENGDPESATKIWTDAS